MASRPMWHLRQLGLSSLLILACTATLRARDVPETPEPPANPCWLDENGNFNPDAFPPPNEICPLAFPPIEQVCTSDWCALNSLLHPVPYFREPTESDPGLTWNFPDPDPENFDPCDFEAWFQNEYIPPGETEALTPNPGFPCMVHTEARACVLEWAKWYWEEILGAEPCEEPFDGGDGDGPNPVDTGQPQSEGNDSGCNNLYSDRPIDLARGAKAEFNDDLRIALPGRDFVLQRHDTSDPAHLGPDLLGANQMASPFVYVTPGFNIAGTFPNTSWHVDFHGIATTRRFFAPSLSTNPDPPPTGRYHNPGPSVDYFERGTLELDSTTYAVWRHTEPGPERWVQEFYRQPDGGDTSGVTISDKLVGLLLRESDAYGNVRRYTYASSSSNARLNTIDFYSYLTSGSLAMAAQAKFDWYSTGDNEGRLRQVDVRRFNPPSVVTTDRVHYIYKTESDGLSDAVGTEGDLVQVTKYHLTDDGWQRQVMQYRYHNPDLNEDPEDDDDGDGYKGEHGEAHQLKLVILPEQLEYYAAKDSVASPENAALLLLGDDDDQILFTENGSNVKLVALASKVIPVYESGGQERVLEQYVQQSCGCSGGPSAGRKLTYEYWSYPSQNDPSDTTKITEYYQVEGEYTGVLSTTYHDICRPSGVGGVPYLSTKAVFEGDGGDETRQWVTHYEYDNDDRTVTKQYMPSSISDYEPGLATSPNTQPTYTVNASGLIYAFEYTGYKQLKKKSIIDGSAGSTYLVEQRTYPTSLSGGQTEEIRYYLPTQIDRYKTGLSTAAADTESQSLVYTFWSSTEALAAVKTTFEAVPESENGSATESFTVTLLDQKTGNPHWTRNADGSLTHRLFNERTGEAASETLNAAWAASSPANPYSTGGAGWGTDANDDPLPGGTLMTTWTRSLAGEVRSTTTPAEVTTYLCREMLPLPDRPDPDDYYAEIALPPIINSGAGEYGGPAVVTWFNAGGDVIATRSYTLESGAGYDESITDFSLDQMIGRTSATNSLTGTIISRRVWHDASDDDAFYETTYRYDTLGRLKDRFDPNGTAREFDYDFLDRKTADSIGVWTLVSGEPTTDDMSVVTEYFYDSGGTATSGAGGDGSLTLIRQHFDGSTHQDTIQTYDFRDRKIKTQNPLSPHSFVVYDNLDRVIKSATFSTLPSGVAASAITTTTGRLSYSEASYDQRGQAYRTATAIDPSASSPTFLESHTWFDDAGRPIAAWAPDSPATKTAYDGLSRPMTVYTVDRSNDVAPGATGNYASAATVAGAGGSDTADTVFKQVTTQYEEETGLPELVTIRRRTHALTTKGDLTGVSSSGVITSYVGYEYDGAGRQVKTINFGTNQSTFESGGSAPTQTSGAWNANGGLVTTVSFEKHGLAEIQTDAAGRETKSFYDDMGRRIAVAENFVNAEVEWSSSLQRWRVSSGLSGSELDTDRVTSFVYNSANQIIKQAAHYPDSGGEGAQVTTYAYGVDLGTGVDTSRIASKDLLRSVTYPGESESVLYEYNRQGQQIAMTDQNGVRHDYELDELGRIKKDSATVPSASDIDDYVTAISYTYDSRGNQQTIKSQHGTTVRNSVKFEYDALNRLETLSEQPFGNMSSGAPKVIYSYETAAMGGGNHNRLASIQYPDGTVVETSYGSGDDPDNLTSRAESLQIDGETDPFVEYQYFGTSMPVVTSYPVIDVELDLTKAADGAYTAGLYPALDRFGRQTSQMWVDGGFGTGSGGNPNRPPIVHLSYGYDVSSNRTKRYDLNPATRWSTRHEEFEYDKLNRVQKSWRGVRTGGTANDWNTSHFTFAPSTQAWSLDMLGNWATVETNASTSGTYATSESRTHNATNDLTNRTITGTGSGSLDITYDDVGNILDRQVTPGSSGLHYVYTHDAWNRLVKVQTDDGTTVQDLAAYVYNGKHWRVLKQVDLHGSTSSSPPDGTYDQQRTMYYSADAGGWRLIQTEIDQDIAEEDGDEIREEVFYGLRGTDDIVLRRLWDITGSEPEFTVQWHHLTDPQFSTVAILNDAAQVVERADYDPYGLARHHGGGDVLGTRAVDSDDLFAVNNNWGNYGQGDLTHDGTVDSDDLFTVINGWSSALPEGALSSDSYTDNQFGYCGYVFNPEIGSYTARFRWYDPVLGRWLSRDPAGYKDGMSLYAYVGGNPLLMVDPLGLYGFGLFGDICAKALGFDSEYDAVSRTGVALGEELRDIGEGMLTEAMKPQAQKDAEFASEVLDIETNAALAQGRDFSVWGLMMTAMAKKTGMQTMAEGMAGIDMASMTPLDATQSATRVALGTSQGLLTAAVVAAPVTTAIEAPLARATSTVASAEANAAVAAERSVMGSLPGEAGVQVPGRLSASQMEALTVEHNVEFSLIYRTGAGKNGGGGNYWLYSGTRRNVMVPTGEDVRWIYHTHPGGTRSASGADYDVLRQLQTLGSPQRSSQIIPVGNGEPFRFDLHPTQ